jgi:hypothetical protein
MKFIKIIDNAGDYYYVNPSAIAYLKSNAPTPANHYPNKQIRVNKVVLKNDKQIIVPSVSDFSEIKIKVLHEEEV